MPAKYLYRIDDITPEMDWDNFWPYINLFKKYNVKPLIGIVPDNRDPKLCKGEKRQDFWDVMRKLQQEGTVDFAQHGYQHVYTTFKRGLLGAQYGFSAQSEFVGLSYQEQYDKIKAGMNILKHEKIETNIWMAPSHSYDKNTLKALYNLKFKSVTDGIALYPYIKDKLIFIPQQMWSPRYFPFGIMTICLHPSTDPSIVFNKIEIHLNNTQSISINEALNYQQGNFMYFGNTIFKLYFIIRTNTVILKNKFIKVLKKISFL